MGSLKHSWRREKFSELVTHVAERVEPTPEDTATYIGLEHLDSGSLTVRRWGSPTELVGTKLRVKRGDVLFARRNAYLRRVAISPHDGLFSAHGMVLRPNPQHILPDFLPFFLQSDVFMNRAEKISVGSLSPTINWSSLREEEFSLPPMEEQQRLVSILNAITDTINAASDGLDRGEQARDSIIVGLYSRGTEDGATQDTEIGILPKSWRLEPLGTRFHIQLGKMMSESARSADGKIPYIRNANVQWNRLDLNDVATMSFTPDERKKFSLRHGDILACEGRHVGKAAMWRGEIPGACYQKALHRLRAIRDDVPSYLLHCLYYYSRTGRFGAVTGETTIPHLPAERLRAMLFPFPDREEQLEIAEIVDAFDKSIKQLRTRRASAVTMLRAVLAMEAT